LPGSLVLIAIEKKNKGAMKNGVVSDTNNNPKRCKAPAAVNELRTL